MSEYPYEDKIQWWQGKLQDGIFRRWNKNGQSCSGIFRFVIVKLEKEENNMEIKYEIPRLEISSLTDDRITLKLKRNEIDEKYETSSIKKSPK